MNMREKMARAAWESNRARHTDTFSLPPWEEVEEPTKGDWFNFIDAVLEALREPTEAMQCAALDLGPGRSTQDYYCAYIDAAKAGR